ncbi:uncharacterized protein LOC120895192 [Anopheles arabiensis]|uniref:uncharacterized protein LOC120895192 n=1 Tax=Anopheles arabiensis TaxID=7173 RepID=UPI001AAD1300|nr:uncharacterized protein LOC120895192 [Anopheles arabiensis]
MAQRDSHRMPRTEETLASNPDMPLESGNVSGGLRYDPSTPGPPHALPSEGCTPRSVIASLNASGEPRYDTPTPGPSNAVPAEGCTPSNVIPAPNAVVLREGVQRKAVSSPIHETHYTAYQGRADARESRRRRLQALEREIAMLRNEEDDSGAQTLRDAEDENGAAAIAEHPNYGGTGGTHYPEFAEWVKGFEESLRRTYEAEKATSQGQAPGGNDLGHRAIAVPAQHTQPNTAITSSYGALPSHTMHQSYETQPTNSKQQRYVTQPTYATPITHASQPIHATQTLSHATHSHPAYTIQTQPIYTTHSRPIHMIPPQHEYVQPLFNTSALSQSQIAARQPVPHDLPIFSGEPEAWLLFIATYNRTNAACGYTDDENIGRLQYALRGAALEAVGNLLSFPAGLKEAMATLKARFGRPDLIVESMTDKIRKMAPPNVDKLSTVVEFGYAVKRLVGAMTASGLRGYMYDVALLKELVRKLPPVLCIDWARTRRHLGEVTLVEFSRWVGDLAEDLCGVIDVIPGTGDADLYRRQPESHHNRSQPQRFQTHRAPPAPVDRRPPVGTGRVHPAYCNTTVLSNAPSTINATDSLPVCTLCGGDCPALAQCERFRRSTVAARRAFVNERRICRKCLRYHGGGCSVKMPCVVNGCNGQRHELLLLDDQTPASPNQRDLPNGTVGE